MQLQEEVGLHFLWGGAGPKGGFGRRPGEVGRLSLCIQAGQVLREASLGVLGTLTACFVCFVVK